MSSGTGRSGGCFSIELKKGDSIESLKAEFPQQKDEIDAWQRSNLTVTYGRGPTELHWRFTGANSLLILIGEISAMLRPSAAQLSATSATSQDIWRQVRKSCRQYPEDAEQLFRIFLLLHRNAGRLTSLLENTHGVWRRRLIQFLTTKLYELGARPVIEGDILEALPDRPGEFRDWALTGWTTVESTWLTLDPTRRADFIWDVFDHTKGYNRAVNFASQWATGESPASQLKDHLKRRFKTPPAKPKPHSKAYISLWIEVLGKLMMYARMTSFEPDDWKRLFARDAADLEDALSVAGFNREDISSFLDSGLAPALEQLSGGDDWPAVDESEFVELRLPKVKPFPKVPGW